MFDTFISVEVVESNYEAIQKGKDQKEGGGNLVDLFVVQVVKCGRLQKRSSLYKIIQNTREHLRPIFELCGFSNGKV